jgi:CheY-like chemotaxis protein
MSLAGVHREEPLRILIVEDHLGIRRIEIETLNKLGYAVDGTSRADKALQLLERLPYDLLITDVRLPGELDGIALAHRVREFLIRPKTLVVGAHLERYPREQVKGICDEMLSKPFTLAQLKSRVASLIGLPRSRCTAA